jgi:hypothetical protein
MMDQCKKIEAEKRTAKLKRDREEEHRTNQRLKLYNALVGVFENERALIKKEPEYWESQYKQS